MQTEMNGAEFEDTQLERLLILKNLFAEVAHETRNIMQSISGFVELELASCQSEESRKRLKRILEDAFLAGEMSGSLLKLTVESKGAAGSEANDAIRTILDLYKYRSRCGISFVWKPKALSP